MSEMFNNDSSKYFSYNKKALSGNDTAIPCGLVAKSFFQDEFYIKASDEISIDIDETKISDPYDRKYNFKNSKDSELTQWIDLSNGKYYISLLNNLFLL